MTRLTHPPSDRYRRTEPPQLEVESDPGFSLWPVIALAVAATVLLFGATVGFLPPLFLFLLVLGVARLFRSPG